MKKKIAIFASGSGSNAENIIRYFANSDKIEVSIILTNNKDAYVIERAKQNNVPYLIFSKSDLRSDFIFNYLISLKINYIVLAGFLLLIPEKIIKTYRNKIINIHPALLPKFGGKGMFGMNVHKAVIESKESESGISIHFVNENYDEGQIIFRAKCIVDKNDTPESLSEKVHNLEYEHFPVIIDKKISKN